MKALHLELPIRTGSADISSASYAPTYAPTHEASFPSTFKNGFPRDAGNSTRDACAPWGIPRPLTTRQPFVRET